MTIENADELAIAHNVTEEEVLSYLMLATQQPLLVKQACILKDKGFSRENVRRWLYFKTVDAPMEPAIEQAITLCLSNL